MNSKYTIKLIMVFILVLLIGREFAPTNKSSYLYKSYYDSSSISNFKTRNYMTKKSSFGNENDLINFDYKDTSKIVFHDLKNRVPSKNPDLNNNINIYVKKDLNVGFTRYIPLVKFVSFNSDINYYWDFKVEKKDSIMVISGSGVFNIEGSTKVYGICSGKRVAQEIKKRIQDEFKKVARKNIVTK